MTIVGFNFTKISIEKTAPVKGKVNISNNVAITSVEKTELALGKDKQNALKFMFEFTSTYDPKIAMIELKGEVLYLADSGTVKDVLDKWKKEKQLPKEIMTELLNNVLIKCNIQALILSKDMNVPPPIPMPKVKEAQ
jgi:hypothetical protein